MLNLPRRDLLWTSLLAISLGALFSFRQPGNWLLGSLSFSFIFLLSFIILIVAYRWSTSTRTLGFIIALAFAIRLLVGVTLYFSLPIYGHDSVDDNTGYVFTDARRRDDQAWEFATSERPILVAFTDKFAYDQYGGLLAFSAFVYRYFSPDAHRPLMLVLISAFFGALGVPFLWRAVHQTFGEKAARAAVWIFALYPESILLGSSAMREPYLLTFSTIAFYGFVELFHRIPKEQSEPTLALHTTPVAPPVPAAVGKSSRSAAWIALGIGLLGMILISPAISLATLIIFAGWIFVTSERVNISWITILLFATVFLAGLFFLSGSLNRSGEFDTTSPLHVINDWLRLAVRWDAYQLERESGWVQKIFDESPAWIRLPFVTVYGLFQPVLPASIVHPNKPIRTAIVLLRGLGWYAMIPFLLLSFGAAVGSGSRKMRNLILCLTLFTWTWIILAALRGGGDLWDNPRYRTMLFLWQSILAGYVWVWWRETRNAWLLRILAMEGVFLLVFTQWYASRYYHWGGQLPFAVMIALILSLWGLIIAVGWWQDRKRALQPRM